ncbi:methylamine dehydrogenase accessory protein MauD [Parvibaculaceae bacterium PLY_AMNH_Bact1]|nr:methylamine dehydrogenase accessory protein MauD [Parvibaculaceae bacterium PLY_AMNH_Bact1]
MIDALIISNIVSWIAIAALCLIVFALTRQIGLLHERMGPVGALTVAKGMKAGEALPPFSFPSLTGGQVEVGAGTNASKSTLLFFLSPDCPVCKSLLPVIASVRSREASWLDVVLASDGEPSEHQAFLRNQNLEDYPYILSADLGLTIGVSKLPYAALVDERGTMVAHGLTNTREHIESLFEAKTRGVASIQDYMEQEQQRA